MENQFINPEGSDPNAQVLPPEPANIADAFGLLAVPAEESIVGDNKADGGDGSGQPNVQEGGQPAGADGGLTNPQPASTGEGTTPEVIPAVPEAQPNSEVDYTGFRQEANKTIMSLAQQALRNEMQEAGVSQIIPANLKQTDERGNVYWINPDDKNRPFQTRAEAQAWCADRDAEIKQVSGQRMHQIVGEYAKAYEPYIKMHEFVPTYNKMTKAEVELFEPLVAQYEITDDNGDIVGYRCNLDQALNMVRSQLSSINAKYGGQKGEAAPAIPPAQPSGPAVAIGGSAATPPPPPEAGEPKDINEAMAFIMAKENEKFKKGNK